MDSHPGHRRQGKVNLHRGLVCSLTSHLRSPPGSGDDTSWLGIKKPDTWSGSFKLVVLFVVVIPFT
jgi:hypothetical protein